MTAGGKRKGSGRKEGSATKKTIEIAKKASEAGISPLEVMLENMRWAHSRVNECTLKFLEGDITDGSIDAFKNLLGLRTLAQDCAKDAAPYVHPRLAAMTVGNPDGEELVFRLRDYRNLDDNRKTDRHTEGLPAPIIPA